MFKVTTITNEMTWPKKYLSTKGILRRVTKNKSSSKPQYQQMLITSRIMFRRIHSIKIYYHSLNCFFIFFWEERKGSGRKKYYNIKCLLVQESPNFANIWWVRYFFDVMDPPLVKRINIGNLSWLSRLLKSVLSLLGLL